MRTELLAIVLIACGADKSSAPDPAPSETGPAALAANEFYRLEAMPQGPCQVGKACEAQLVLTALGDYKVNDEYPTKLLPEPVAGVEIAGPGRFAPQGKSGTMKIAFTAKRAGATKVPATFKLSVCNADNCQIESPKIAFDVTAN